MKRWFYNLLVALTILIAIASMIAWIMTDQQSSWFEFAIGDRGPNGGQMWPYTGWFIDCGNGSLSIDHRSSGTHWDLELWRPIAIAVLSLLQWSGIPATMYLEHKSKPPGICATCGYDLRATPDRCPECGNAGVEGNV